MLVSATPIKLHATHSSSTLRLAEQRFFTNMSIFEVKEILSRKYGTISDYVTIELHSSTGQVTKLSDESKTLADYLAVDFDTIHVIDQNPNSVLVKHNLDDVSTVKKYEISKEDYAKRGNSIRNFKKNLSKDPNHKLLLEKNQEETYEQQSLLVTLESRCLLGDGLRRGLVKYVGKIPDLGQGFWVGVLLDEPMGDSNGK